MTELKNTLQQKRFKVLLVGDNCEDIYRYGTVDRISPEAPVPIFKISHEESRPGMAANVAENLEKLGCDVDFFTGEASRKIRLIDSKSGQHIVRIDEDVKSQPADFATNIPNFYDAVVVSDYDKGTVTYSLLNDLRSLYNGPIFIDTKKTDLSGLGGCFVKINELEYSKLKKPCRELIVTMSDKGARYGDKQFSAPKVGVVDVTGAGDTFLAALTYSYIDKGVMDEAINFAIKAASITVQHLGVYAPTLDEICD